MKILVIFLLALTTCQFIQKNKEPLPVVKCLLESEKLTKDVIKAIEAVQKFIEDKDVLSLITTALEVVPDAYYEVMKCLNEDVNLQFKIKKPKIKLPKPKNLFKKIEKELKNAVKKVPKRLIEEGKQILKEKGLGVAKNYCHTKIKVSQLCDNIENIVHL